MLWEEKKKQSAYTGCSLNIVFFSASYSVAFVLDLPLCTLTDTTEGKPGKGQSPEYISKSSKKHKI